MARLFKEVLSTEFKGCFKTVVFAIYDDHNAGPGGNVQPFADVFNRPAIISEDVFDSLKGEIKESTKEEITG